MTENEMNMTTAVFPKQDEGRVDLMVGDEMVAGIWAYTTIKAERGGTGQWEILLYRQKDRRGALHEYIGAIYADYIQKGER